MVTATQSPITLETLRARREEILEVAQKYSASNVRVFGSVAKGEAKAGSDIDFLVNFMPSVSLLVSIGLIQALEDLLGTKVDVLTEPGLHPLLRDEILRSVAVL